MQEMEKQKERVIICGVHRGLVDVLSDSTEETMAELEELVKTAGGEVVAQVLQNRNTIEKATYVGEGKLEEIKNACQTLGADLLVFDDELSGSQIRNIEDITGVRVIDRSTLILDIFASRARSAEGKIQVELAQLKYMLPRLTGMGEQLSRLGGGIGTRGPGETKLEIDRRHIRARIEALEEKLVDIKKHRALLREGRKKQGHLVAALVGYTNSGKSTLLNTLTNAGVFAENMLFATLDTTYRGITLSDSRNCLIVDTVGFIRKLPHHLINAFKSTLEEVVEADALIHVVDSTNPEMANQIEVVNRLLGELNCGDKPQILALNKTDARDGKIIPRPSGKYDHIVNISAKYNIGIDELLKALEEVLPGKKIKTKFLFPYTAGDKVALIHQNELVLEEEYGPLGTTMVVMADRVLRERLKEFVIE